MVCVHALTLSVCWLLMHSSSIPLIAHRFSETKLQYISGPFVRYGAVKPGLHDPSRVGPG